MFHSPDFFNHVSGSSRASDGRGERLNRIVSMTILERSNLHGDRVTREMARAECTTPEPNALYSAAIDRMCAAVGHG